MFSHSEKYIVEQRGNWQHAERQDRAGYFWYETKSQLSNFVIFLGNSNNKYHYMVFQCAVTDHCTASVQVACKPIIFSYLLKAQIKHEGTSEHISFQLQKDDNSHNFSFSYSFYFWCKRAFTFAKNKLFLHITNKQARPTQMRKRRLEHNLTIQYVSS